jgi:hypothetical protein
MAEVQYKEPARTTEGENFLIELVVQGKVVRVPAKCYNRESASHTALAVLAMNYPNVQGYNILTADGQTLLEEVHPTPLFMSAAPIIQQITGQQPLKMAVPVVKSVKPEEFDKMVKDAKEKGKLIQ